MTYSLLYQNVLYSNCVMERQVAKCLECRFLMTLYYDGISTRDRRKQFNKVKKHVKDTNHMINMIIEFACAEKFNTHHTQNESENE